MLQCVNGLHTQTAQEESTCATTLTSDERFVRITKRNTAGYGAQRVKTDRSLWKWIISDGGCKALRTMKGRTPRGPARLALTPATSTRHSPHPPLQSALGPHVGLPSPSLLGRPQVLGSGWGRAGSEGSCLVPRHLSMPISLDKSLLHGSQTQVTHILSRTASPNRPLRDEILQVVGRELLPQ